MAGLSEKSPAMFRGGAKELVHSFVRVGVLLNGEAPNGFAGVADGRALDEGRAGFADDPLVPFFVGIYTRFTSWLLSLIQRSSSWMCGYEGKLRGIPEVVIGEIGNIPSDAIVQIGSALAREPFG